MTNILSLPLLAVEIETGTNEAWRDSWAFRKASSALAYPGSSNIGNGTFGTISIGPNTSFGGAIVRIVSVSGGVTIFVLTELDGTKLELGAIGVPFSGSGFSFTLSQGSTAFVENDSFVIGVTTSPIDLTGIYFSVAVQVSPGRSQQVILGGDTADGSLINLGAAGILSTAFTQSVILQRCKAGTYGFDVVASAAGEDPRRVVTGPWVLVDGYSYKFAS